MFSKNWRFSDVFREYRSGTLVENVLTVDTFLFFYYCNEHPPSN